MKKKNIFLFLVILLLLSSFSYSLEQYNGMPQMPYIIYGKVLHNGAPASGLRMQVTNTNTGHTESFIVSSEGFYQLDAMNWLTTSAGRPPVMYGDSIRVKVLDGCSSGDVCEKIFSAMNSPYKDYAEVGFSISGGLACPLCTSTSCNCGGSSGGSGGGVIFKATQELCDKDFPCKASTCPETPCPECNPSQSCESCPAPSEYCNEIDDICGDSFMQMCNLHAGELEACKGSQCSDTGIAGIIASIIGGLVAGGTAVYLSVGTGANKLKVFKKDGKELIWHKHPTVSGYHDPNTLHNANPHKKGELLPKYVDGKYQS